MAQPDTMTDCHRYLVLGHLYVLFNDSDTNDVTNEHLLNLVDFIKSIENLRAVFFVGSSVKHATSEEYEYFSKNMLSHVDCPAYLYPANHEFKNIDNLDSFTQSNSGINKFDKRMKYNSYVEVGRTGFVFLSTYKKSDIGEYRTSTTKTDVDFLLSCVENYEENDDIEELILLLPDLRGFDPYADGMSDLLSNFSFGIVGDPEPNWYLTGTVELNGMDTIIQGCATGLRRARGGVNTCLVLEEWINKPIQPSIEIIGSLDPFSNLYEVDEKRLRDDKYAGSQSYITKIFNYLTKD